MIVIVMGAEDSPEGTGVPGIEAGPDLIEPEIATRRGQDQSREQDTHPNEQRRPHEPGDLGFGIDGSLRVFRCHVRCYQELGVTWTI